MYGRIIIVVRRYTLRIIVATVRSISGFGAEDSRYDIVDNNDEVSGYMNAKLAGVKFEGNGRVHTETRNIRKVKMHRKKDRS